jgi:hypothetical protein
LSWILCHAAGWPRLLHKQAWGPPLAFTGQRIAISGLPRRQPDNLGAGRGVAGQSTPLFHPWFAPFEEVGPFALNEITEAERKPAMYFKEGWGVSHAFRFGLNRLPKYIHFQPV